MKNYILERFCELSTYQGLLLFLACVAYFESDSYWVLGIGFAGFLGVILPDRFESITDLPKRKRCNSIENIINDVTHWNEP